MSDKVENQMSTTRLTKNRLTRKNTGYVVEFPDSDACAEFHSGSDQENKANAELFAAAIASSRAPEGAERTSAIAALEAEWLSQDKILDYRNWLQDKLLQSRATHAHSEGVDAKELAELRAIVGRCEKTSPGVLGGRCDRPKGHRGSHETRNGMTTWLGPNDEPELSERVDGSSECQACRYVEAVIEQHYGRLVSIRKVIEDLEEAQGAKK